MGSRATSRPASTGLCSDGADCSAPELLRGKRCASTHKCTRCKGVMHAMYTRPPTMKVPLLTCLGVVSFAALTAFNLKGDLGESKPKPRLTGKEQSDVQHGTLPLIVDLDSELGNHLNYISSALALRKWALENRGIDLKLFYNANRTHNLWKRSVVVHREMRECFPEFANVEFMGDPDIQYELGDLLDEQERLFPVDHNKFVIEQGTGQYQLNKTFDLVDLLVQNRNRGASGANLTAAVPPGFEFPFIYKKKYALPFLKVTPEERQHFFRINAGNPTCCKDVPRPGETVLHVRGFHIEVPRWAAFEELDANGTASLLLGHLDPRSEVAILSRFPDSMGDLEVALEARGLSARVVSGQTGMQDFCFMTQASRLAGHSKSSYFVNAANFANAERVDDYRIITNRERDTGLSIDCRDMKDVANVHCHVIEQ